MKFSVSSYSFSQYLRSEKLTLTDCISKVKEMGFDGIEFTDSALGSHDIEDTAKRLADAAFKAGLEISNYAVSADFLNGSDGDIEKEVQRVCSQVDIAKILSSPLMRHDVCNGRTSNKYEGYDNVIERLAYGCRKVTEYAQSVGIKTMTENHGFFSQDSTRVEKLINTVADNNFGWLIDIGNFLCADDDPAAAVGRAARYAFYVHAKDFIVKSGQSPNPGAGFFMSRGGNFLRGTIIGHGDVPVMQCLYALKNAGYDGYIAIEFEGMEDCVNGVKTGLDNLKNYVNTVYSK